VPSLPRLPAARPLLTNVKRGCTSAKCGCEMQKNISHAATGPCRLVDQVPRNVGLEMVGHGFVLGTLL
jgi:hypothetical protein